MGAALAHRERVLRAIDHRDVDHVPCFFAAEPDLHETIKAKLHLHDEMEIVRFFDADTIHVRPVAADDAVGLPSLKQVQCLGALDELTWPSRADIDVEASRQAAKEAHESGLAVLGGAWASIFTHPRRLMGEQTFLSSLIAQPELVEEIVRRTTDTFINMNQALFSRAARYIDVFYFGSDFGTQRSMFISPAMFRRFFKPHLERLASHAKSFGLKVMFHTCGAISPIIPDLVECGIDVLDPVQVSARSMDPANLAARHKGTIAFHGGISTQTTLPFGTPEQVRREVESTILTLGPLGHICGPDQHMIGDVPVENIVAMYDAICAYEL
jgi:uroporphyrinogen decarboxylase